MVHTVTVHLYAKPDETTISTLRAKLLEASAVYAKDSETLAWYVMQDVADPRAFTIVERYVQRSSLKQHQENPFFKQFNQAVGGFG